MRYKINPILKGKCEKKLSSMLSNLSPATNDFDVKFEELLRYYFELGFDEGCESSSIYSKELKELYKPIDADVFGD